MTSELLIRDVEVAGQRVDVLVEGATIREVGPSLRPPSDAEIVEGNGGALIPGLHDHHIHLLAAAAAARSVRVGPDDVHDRAGFQSTLRAADQVRAPGRWIRAIGYHESVAGDLDRDVLDAIVSGRAVRVQHRSGGLWVLNSAAIASLGESQVSDAGAETDATGRLTGRLYRSDTRLRLLLPDGNGPDLGPVGARLLGFGVTGVTDATPFDDLSGPCRLAEAVASGALPLRVVVMGGIELVDTAIPEGLESGPVKLVIDDGKYPPLEELSDAIGAAHAHDRPVAIHCVTRTSVALALAAWDSVGAHVGDRIEHGAVMPPELVEHTAQLGLTVVTQPGFIAERGDQYREEVDPDDLPHLYPCASLIEGLVRVAGSTDAPFSMLDPWAAMRAAKTRASHSGKVLNPRETVSALRALHLFLGDAGDPGGPIRTVAPGAPADLCLLGVPLVDALRELSADNVVTTIRSGSPRPAKRRVDP